MEKRELSNGMIELAAPAGKWLHRKGTDIYVAKAPVPQAKAHEWEEVDARPPYTGEEYSAEVERLIALRYSTGKEIQFAREKEAAGEKYDEYLAYVESCKLNAIKNLTSGENIDV